ncbi:MAG: hypothetical protein JNL32_11075 [Candidatus Kapabacteria bacterium]|nr:hypothetical protein [Candidatus Kapabacteria bacterium]
MSDILKSSFQHLVSAYTDDIELNDSLWIDIVTAYSEQWRHYHTLCHLELMLLELQNVKYLINDWNSVLFALFYHDIVYLPTRTDNEEVSAVFLSRVQDILGVPHRCRVQSEEFVRATSGHTHTTEIDKGLFLDADLAILGQEWEKYSLYAANIRREYGMFSDVQYNEGRAAVLRRFLNMKFIYSTNEFRDRYEIRAKENLQRELSSS